METKEYDRVQAVFSGTNYGTTITASGNSILSDEPIEIGGLNSGLNPFELVIAGLASCTIATIKMYLDRKGWTVDSIEVNVELETSEESDPSIIRFITIKSDLSLDQLRRVLAVANACPVHKLLSKGISISSKLV
jgi:putative redox protein